MLPLNNKKYILTYLCLGFVLALNIYFRSFPINFPQLKIQAKKIIEQQIQEKATQDVYRRFPQFNPLAKDRLIKGRVGDYWRQDAKAIRRQINELYLNIKDRFQDKTGQTYLMELDCWHWARYVENVLRYGHPGDETINGKQWDSLMFAPFGTYMHWDNLLFYLSAFFYKVFCLFKPVPLFTFLFYLPLFYAAIFVIVLYLFSYRFGGNLAAVISSLFIGLAPICLQRTYAGWFKKETLSLTFSILVVWAYIRAYSVSSYRQKLLWICLSAFWVGLFSFNWLFWWFIFAIIIIVEVISLASLTFSYLIKKEKALALLKERVITLAIFISFSFFWVFIFSGTEPITELWNNAISTLNLNKPLMASIWPNVYYTVGELRKAEFAELAGSMGGRFVFISSMFCLLVLILHSFSKYRYTGIKRECTIILTVWFLSMGFASTRGIRFALFMLPPLGISLGWVISDSYGYFKKRYKGWSVTVAGITTSIIFIVFAFSFINKGYLTAKGLFPLMDDTWYAVLNLIKEKTPDNTIINSWWDFGDWFKAVGKRRVIFDGQSQLTPQAYWMGKALLDNDEEEAARILRMLNNGGNRAFEIIDEHIKDPLQSVLLLESILSFDPVRAKQTLLGFLPEPAANEVIKILFSTPSKAVFVVDPSMVGKIVAISYLGNWNFSKVYMAQNFNQKEKDQILEHLKKLGRNPAEMQVLYQEVFLISPGNLEDWISQRVQFYSGLANGHEKDGNIFFDHGFIYNPKEQIIYANSGQIPRSLFVLIGNNLVEIGMPNANVGFSALVVKTKEGYKSILLDRQLANSLFVRLYFFNGMGLRHFAPFIESEQGTEHIRVFNIVW
jgi:hypothetical protein